MEPLLPQEADTHQAAEQLHELLTVWEAVRDGNSDFGELRRGETVIASMPFWQAVALAREHNKSLSVYAAILIGSGE